MTLPPMLREICRDTENPTESPTSGRDLGSLPDWNLDDLYTGIDAPELAADFERMATACTAFGERYEGKLAGLDGDGLATAIAAYEDIDRVLGRVMSFAGLLYHQNTQDMERAKFMGDAQARVTDITQPLVFFSLELNRLDEDQLAARLAESPALARYRPLLSDSDRSRREAGGRAVAKVLGANIRLFTRITNTLVKEKEVEDRWRKLPAPDHGRHLANQVEPEVVDALREAVQAASSRLSHRYYAMKARWLGLEKLEYWDRNAPLPESDDRIVSWRQAREIVLDAYSGFSPRMAELAEPFFERGWIDAAVKPGKAPGAFAHPTVTDVHPYVMLNYLGKPRDVMTLAHELGHGVHQRLAAGQGELLSRTPLTLAETASVFGEMLTFRKMLAEAPDRTTRKMMLAGKVEDMINTVVRQIAFYEFERRVHAARREGELTDARLGEIWMAVQGESLGPAVNLPDEYSTFWAYIPHFIHSPFYVYAYAFGDGLVNALYAVYAEGDAGFQDKYFDMLAAGGTLHHKELLAPFGLDASDPAFWDKGLNLIASMIDELEAMG